MSTDRAKPLTVLYAGDPDEWTIYQEALTAACTARDLPIHLVREASDPVDVDYIVYAPDSDLRNFSAFSRTKAVLSLWAGVEKIVDNSSLTQPLVRMVDHGLTRGMVEWVTGHVLRHHLGMDRHVLGQTGDWQPLPTAPLAEERPVGILGLGTLGCACAEALTTLGFPVSGWSRSPKVRDGIACFHGDQGLAAVLGSSQILVLLLPATPATRNVLGADALARLPRGAVVINPGRGSLIDDAALLAALDASHIGHATLDVFDVEPLPPEHPYWAHPKVTVTPHIASITRPRTAARSIAQSIAEAEAGLPLSNVVDRTQSY